MLRIILDKQHYSSATYFRSGAVFEFDLSKVIIIFVSHTVLNNYSPDLNVTML